jgi:hypothetical protein
MKRVATLIVIVAAVAAAAVFSLDRDRGDPRRGNARPDPDSVWYHASDVALLARTGRPQLVEFFHPD